MSVQANGIKKIEILLLLGFYKHSPNVDIIKNTLIRSIGRFCDPDFVGRIVIIVPQCQYMLLSSIVGVLPFSVIIGTYEEFLLSMGVESDLDSQGREPAIVELYFSKICKTDYYLVLNEMALVTGFINGDICNNDRMPASFSETVLGYNVTAENEKVRNKASNVSLLSPIFINADVAKKLIDNCVGLDSIKSWRSRYWSILKDDKSGYVLYYNRDVNVYFESASDLKLLFGGINHSTRELFSVFEGLPTNENTNKFIERRLTTKSGGSYEYIAEATVKDLLNQNVNVWQTSFGGVGSNYIARMLRVRGGQETYELLCHFPYPLPVQKPNFKAIYVFGDPELAIISQLNKNHQINMAKNSNINYNMSWCYEFSLEKYAAEQRDYFNLAEHFHNWTSPEGPLRNVSYPVLMLRFQTSMKYLSFIGNYLSLDEAGVNNLKEKFVIKPRSSSSVLDNPGPDIISIRKLYKTLAEEIESFPDAAIWNPVTRRVECL